MSKKPTAVDTVMSELFDFGGEQKTRAEIQQELTAEGQPPRLIDWYLFCLSQQRRQQEQEGRT